MFAGLLAIAAAMLAPAAQATCVFTQKGANGIPFAEVHEPAPLPGMQPGMPLMMNPCPEYTDLACCNPAQYQALGIHLYVSASAFSKPSTGGNPACGENLRQLWCGLTCHPNQSLWVDPSPVHEQRGGKEVMPANISLGKTFACGLFDSCKSTQRASLDPVLTTSVQSLLNFMGRDQGKDNGVWYTFDFEDDEPAAPADDDEKETAQEEPALPDGLKPWYGPAVQYCCNYNASIYELNVGSPPPAGISASGNMSAPCSFCQTSCPHHTCPVAGSGPGVDVSALEKPMFGPWHGMDYATLAGLYGGIAVVTVGVLVYSARRG